MVCCEMMQYETEVMRRFGRIQGGLVQGLCGITALLNTWERLLLTMRQRRLVKNIMSDEIQYYSHRVLLDDAVGW